jgi:hypothetical protein
MRIGYARVSTAEQNLNLQLDALKKAKCKRIYEEHGSGKDSARLELLSCLKALRADDVLVVWRLDRLGRSLSELVRIAGQLEHRKIGLESITEKIETVYSAGQAADSRALERPYGPREGCGQALWRERRHRVQTRRRRHAGEISWSMANRYHDRLKILEDQEIEELYARPQLGAVWM